jgi:hypothetical protein
MEIKTFEHDVYLDGEVISTIVFKFWPELLENVIEMHQEIYKWSPAAFKEMLNVWEDVKFHLKKQGIEKVVTVCPTGNYEETTLKYWKRMGGSDPLKCVALSQEVWYSEFIL